MVSDHRPFVPAFEEAKVDQITESRISNGVTGAGFSENPPHNPTGYIHLI